MLVSLDLDQEEPFHLASSTTACVFRYAYVRVWFYVCARAVLYVHVCLGLAVYDLAALGFANLGRAQSVPFPSSQNGKLRLEYAKCRFSPVRVLFPV